MIFYPAYFGPGAGFAFLGSFLSIVLAVLAGIASLILWPFRAAWLLFRRRGGSRCAGLYSSGWTDSIPALPRS